MCSGAVSVNGDLKHTVRCPFVLVDAGLPQKSSHKGNFSLEEHFCVVPHHFCGALKLSQVQK